MPCLSCSAEGRVGARVLASCAGARVPTRGCGSGFWGARTRLRGPVGARLDGCRVGCVEARAAVVLTARAVAVMRYPRDDDLRDALMHPDHDDDRNAIERATRKVSASCTRARVCVCGR